MVPPKQNSVSEANKLSIIGDSFVVILTGIACWQFPSIILNITTSVPAEEGWYRSFVLPASATDEQAQDVVQPQPMVITVVLEKRDGTWKIVHTHNSDLGPPVGQ